jgi:hypothetical protein
VLSGACPGVGPVPFRGQSGKFLHGVDVAGPALGELVTDVLLAEHSVGPLPQVGQPTTRRERRYPVCLICSYLPIYRPVYSGIDLKIVLMRNSDNLWCRDRGDPICIGRKGPHLWPSTYA